MGKIENELLKIYLHNRKTQDYDRYKHYDYNVPGYEIRYLIKTGQVEPEKIETTNIMNAIIDYPEFYHDPDAAPYLDKLVLGNKGQIIGKHPEFFDIFGPEITNELSPLSIEVILSQQPQLIDKFDLSKLRDNEKQKILTKQPQFIEREEFANTLPQTDDLRRSLFLHDFMGYSQPTDEKRDEQREKALNAIANYPIYRNFFKKELKEMNGYDIVKLLIKDYSLLPYFDLTKLNDYAIANLLERFPELVTKVNQDEMKMMSDWKKESLLQKRPQLKKYFDHG